MLECQSYGARFAQPRAHREHRGYCFGRPAWEWVDACPRCGGAYIELPEGAPSRVAAVIDGDKAVVLGDGNGCVMTVDGEITDGAPAL